jgi:predicted AAA+ superfamily ATPase
MFKLQSIMEKLIEIHQQIIRETTTNFVRSFANQIHWEERLIGIKGAKGVGKTTLLLQHIKTHLKDKKSIYISLDNPYFYGNSLMETVDDLIKLGFTNFFLDEVHKYPTWSAEIKTLHDTYRKMKIVFTGSSVLHLLKGSADLSRRAMLYDMPGLSFREYIEFVTGEKLTSYSLDEIVKNHEEIALQITERLKPFEFFNDYLERGYYPFFIETPKTYSFRVEAAINQTLESDLPLINKLTPDVIIKLKKILGVIAQSAPFKPNIQKISERVGITRNSLVIYMRYLEEAKIIKQLYTTVSGIGSLQKPQKIYFENPNLIYSLSALSSQIGTVRETFVLNQLTKDNNVAYPKSGDFIINEKYTFEVGGKSKTKKQIAGIENSFIIADKIEVGFGNRIPLWLLGFLY